MGDERKEYTRPELAPLGDKTGELDEDQMRKVTGGGTTGDCWGGSSPYNCYDGSVAHASGGDCGLGQDDPGQCGSGSSATNCRMGTGFEFTGN